MKIKDYIEVSRPPLAILGFLAPIALLTWSGSIHTLKGLLVVLGVGFGNYGWTVYNELKDKETDSINKPWKPVPSGRVNEAALLLIIRLTVVVSIAATLMLGFFDYNYLIALMAHPTSYIYNSGRKGFLGNLCQATAYGLAAFISLYPNHLMFALAFALFTLNYNLSVQYQDLRAERASGVMTAPQQLGDVGTAMVSISISAASFLILFYLYLATSFLPLLVFMAISPLTITSAISIIAPINSKLRDEIIENLNRRLSRLLLMIGFIAMLL